MFSKFKLSKLLPSLGAIGLVVYGFFVAQFIVVFLLNALVEAGVTTENTLNSSIVQFWASVVAYVLALVIILGIFTAIRNSTKGLTKLLAISKRPQLNAIFYVVIGYGTYFLLSFTSMLLAQSLISGFSIDQKQEVGFEQLGTQVEYIMAFIALVVLAPIVEETIFRGFLFTQIRQNYNFWVSAVIVSLVFGLVHLQWNVGMDVFALSLVLCFLREKTGSIWAGVGLHMVKNILAFAILFWQFDIERIILHLL